MEGYSLALDFKNSQKTQELLNKLDLIVNENHGRIYLAKDSRIRKKFFEDGYPFFDTFKRRIKNQNNIQSFQFQRLSK